MRFTVKETLPDGSSRLIEIETDGSDAELKALHALRPVVAPSQSPSSQAQPVYEPSTRFLPSAPQPTHYEPIQQATLITPPPQPTHQVVHEIEPPRQTAIQPPSEPAKPGRFESWKGAIAIGVMAGVLALSVSTGYRLTTNAIKTETKTESQKGVKPSAKPTPRTQPIPKELWELP